MASKRSRRIAVVTDGPLPVKLSVLQTGGHIDRVIQLGPNPPKGQATPDDQDLLNGLDWSPDDKRFIANVNTGAYEAPIKLIDLQGHTRTIDRSTGYDIAWSHRNTLAWTDQTGGLVLRDLSGRHRRRHRFSGTAIAFSPGGGRIASLGGGAYVSNPSGRRLHRVSRRCNGAQVPPAWSPTGRYLACAAIGGGIAVIDLQQETSHVIVRSRRIGSIAWSRR